MIESAQTAADAADRPVQFSLRALLILQALCALFLGMLVTIGIWAVVLLLAATLLFVMVPVRPDQLRGKRLIIDLLGGIVLPVLCFVYDPGIVHGGGGLARAIAPFRGTVYLLVTFQIIVLPVWIFAAPWLGRVAGLLSGILASGALVAAVIGAWLFPLSFLGMIFALIGVLGFTPFLTACVFGRNAGAAFHRAVKRHGLGWALAGLVAGAVLGIAIPAVGYWVADRICDHKLEQLLDSLPRPGKAHVPGFGTPL